MEARAWAEARARAEACDDYIPISLPLPVSPDYTQCGILHLDAEVPVCI